MRIFLQYVFCVFICFVNAGVTKNDKLPEVETTVDGKFIITYPKDEQQKKKQEQNNETYNHPSLNPPQTRIKNLKDKKMPIMPNIGPLTAYGHPSTRYKSIDRNIKKTISSSKNSNKTDSILPDEEMNDPDPDPFVSQRKIKLLVVPDAYAAAPIQVKSHGVFETSTEKIVIAEKLPQSQASELVQDSLETFSTPKNSPSSTNTHHKITSESITPLEIPSTKTKLVSTESSSLSPTTKTNVPEISVATVAVAEKLPIIQTSESNEDSLKSFPATIIFSSPTEIPTLTHHEIMTSESVSAVPITVPSTTTTSQSTESSHLSPTAKINVPRNPSKNITTAQKLPIIQTSESESLVTNTNNSDLPKNTETSAELLNKETTFNEEGSDYDNDVFARLKDDVELIGDNPRSALSESIPRPTLVHPQKSNNKFLHRLFAAPSEAEADEIETENTEEEEIIPEVAFPLPNCYRTAGGFLCCNRVLEELIYRSNSVIQRKQLSECNVHAFAAHLQQEAEKMFKTTFEIVIGTGDFASKSRFKDNLICKTITNKKVILIYGTPEPYSLTSSNTPLAFT